MGRRLLLLMLLGAMAAPEIGCRRGAGVREVVRNGVEAVREKRTRDFNSDRMRHLMVSSAEGKYDFYTDDRSRVARAVDAFRSALPDHLGTDGKPSKPGLYFSFFKENAAVAEYKFAVEDGQDWPEPVNELVRGYKEWFRIRGEAAEGRIPHELDESGRFRIEGSEESVQGQADLWLVDLEGKREIKLGPAREYPPIFIEAKPQGIVVGIDNTTVGWYQVVVVNSDTLKIVFDSRPAKGEEKYLRSSIEWHDDHIVVELVKINEKSGEKVKIPFSPKASVKAS